MTPGVVTQSPQSQSSIGVSGDFSVNGQRTESNYYTVDGVSANTGVGSGAGFPTPGTGGTLSSSTALGTTQSLISVDALQEFRVQSSTYSAAYGRSPGGQFSLVTRSGTKKFHGSGFDYLRNNYFDANNWFNNLYGTPASALRQNDFGGTFGGPIVLPFLHRARDNTFFFVSYEGLRLTQPQATSVQYVPDLAMRKQAASVLQPILNAFPLPTPGGIDYGTATTPSLAQFIQGYALPARIDSTSVRLDQISGRVTISSSGSATLQVLQNPDPCPRSQNNKSIRRPTRWDLLVSSREIPPTNCDSAIQTINLPTAPRLMRSVAQLRSIFLLPWELHPVTILKRSSFYLFLE